MKRDPEGLNALSKNTQVAGGSQDLERHGGTIVDQLFLGLAELWLIPSR